VAPGESNQRPSDLVRTASHNSVFNSNGVWRLHSTYSQYLRRSGNSGHFMFRYLYCGKEIPYWCLVGWVGHSGDLNSYRKIIGGGLLTGEACCTGNIKLNIGRGLLQTGVNYWSEWNAATDSMEWTNISSVIGVSLAQDPSVYERHCTQYYTAEPADSIWKWGGFLHLANRLV